VWLEDPYASVLPESVHRRLATLGAPVSTSRLRALAATAAPACGSFEAAPCESSGANGTAIAGGSIVVAGGGAAAACTAAVVTIPFCALGGVVVAGAGAITFLAGLIQGPPKILSCNTIGLEIRDGYCRCPTNEVWDATKLNCIPAKPYDKTTSNCQRNVQLLAYYTNAALATFNGDLDALKTHITAQVADLNEALGKSGVSDARVELLDIRATALSESGRSASTLLEDLIQFGASIETAIRDERLATRADLVAVFTGSLSEGAGTTCGIGDDRLTKRTGFSLVSTTAGTNCRARFTLAHELGHNFGLHHDRYTIDKGPRYDAPNYNYGYINKSQKVVSIMAYTASCSKAGLSSCSRVPLFSGPAIRHNNTPMGTDIENDIQSLRQAWPKVRDYYGCAP
jgi:hypothetical protein